MFLSTSWRWLRKLFPGAQTNGPCATRKRLRGCGLLLEVLEERTVPAAPTFTALANTAPANVGEMMLLSNGTIMAQNNALAGGIGNAWYALTPTANGNYVNGTWSNLASMSTKRLYFGSAVLPNQTVFVVGGEYGPGTEQDLNSAETYNALTNQWSTSASFPQSQFGDDPLEVLPNGTILGGYLLGPQTYIYNPTANSWSATGTKLYGDPSDEECWVKLPDNSILSYDIFSSISSGTFQAQRYIPSTGQWVDASNTVADANGTLNGTTLSTPTLGYEEGPAFLLPNGNVLQIGATANTAIYDPTTNSWSEGPQIPGGFGADDAPGAVLADGQVIFEADSGPVKKTFASPSALFDYDYNTNTITNITSTLPAALKSSLASGSAYTARMLELPNGQVLFNEGGNQLYAVTPAGSPQTAWLPAVTSITGPVAGAYTLTGTQINGLDEGAAYGDDVMMASNYPIIELKSSGGAVSFATSFNWTSLVATGTTPETTDFTLPAGIADGIYTLTVSANGISSAALPVTISGGVLSVGTTTVSNVSSTDSGTFGYGAIIPIAVAFNNSVDVTGTPKLALSDGGVANYVSGSGTSTLTFNYTVAAGDTTSGGKLDYASSSALTLNGGAIDNHASGGAANLTLAAPGAAGSLSADTGITIDAVAPIVTNITSTTTNGTYSNPSTIVINISFSKVVVVTGTPTLALNSGGTASYTGGSNSNTLTFTYNIAPTDSTIGGNLDAASTTALSGTVTDTVANDPNAANLAVAVGNNTAALANNSALIVAPTVTAVTNVSSSSSNTSYGAGETIAITVNFNAVVNVAGSGTPTLALNTGGTASYTGGSGSSTLTFSYTVAVGEANADLDYSSISAVALNGATIQDNGSNNASLTLPALGTPNSLANNNIVVDAVAPTVTGVSSTTANGTYGVGATISITVGWTHAVSVAGMPTLALNSGGTASYTGGSGSSTLIFTYTVLAGQSSALLEYTSMGALALNNGTIFDTVANDPNAAVLTLPAPGAAGSLSANKNIVIDGMLPTVTNVSSTNANGQYAIGATIKITVTFSTVMTVTGKPQLALNSGGTASYSAGSNSSTLTFTYVVSAGQSSALLDVTGTGGLTLNGGTIKDAVGNAAVLTLPAPGATGSLSANKSIAIDATPPTVLHYYVLFGSQKYDLIGSTRNDLPWKITGIEVVFSEPITTASLASLTGVTKTGFSGLGTNTLTWTFKGLANGTFDTALVAGKIKDAAGNALAGSNTAETFRVVIDDVTGDGVVNQADVTALNAVLGQADNSQNIFADVLGDGTVNAADKAAVKQKASMGE